jgi:SAM-dependent methyltransferase
MPEDYFGERVAERYDERDAASFEPAVVDPVVDFLVDVAGQGAALELGIGTGRVAVPLARRGIRVHGIDLSAAMVAKLRAKPGAEDIEVSIGDFATTKVDGTFSVAYLVVNTIMNLTTQDEQVACFRNVAAHLEPGGCSLSRWAFRSCSDCRRAKRSGRLTSVPRGSASTSTTSRGSA